MKNSLKTATLSVAQKIIDGILAGILIALGGAVYLACVNPELPYARYIGAFLFSLALVCICMRGYSLYTGKIGLLYEKHKKEDISVLFLCLLGNLIGTVLCGYLLALMTPSLKDTALDLCTGKLEQGYGFGFLRAVFCGILVYLAVDIYRNHKTTIGILLCIPAFIICGFEHSIANMFYFAASGIVSGEAFLYLLMIVLGNSVGGLLIPTLQLVRPRAAQENSKDKAEK